MSWVFVELHVLKGGPIYPYVMSIAETYVMMAADEHLVSDTETIIY